MRNLTKALVATLAPVAVASAVVAVPASANAAEADTRTCITKGEFAAVTAGTTFRRSIEIIDSRGTQSYYDAGYPGQYGWPAEQTRDYRSCTHPAWSSVSIDFTLKRGVWRQTGKSAYWG